MGSRSYVLVDLGVIENNYNILKAAVCPAKISAVVKADAYGHGAVAVSKRLQSVGCDRFAVATAEEGARLRRSGVGGEILVLGFTPAFEERKLLEFDLTQTLVSVKHARSFSSKDLKVQIAIDSGMKRVGINCETALKIIDEIDKKHTLTGLYSHLCAADDDRLEDFTLRQISDFSRVCKACVCEKKDIHILNSAGALRYSFGNVVRIGIALYGLEPCKDILPEGLRPALEWKSVVCRVERCKAGESVGYGRGFFCDKDTSIATICTGYADGYPRGLSGKGRIIVNGKSARIIGNICMDAFMADVSGVHVREGDEVTLIGEGVTAEEIAKTLSTINYEIVSRIGARVKRVYKR